MGFLFLGLAIIQAVVFIYAETYQNPLLSMFLKALASFGFITLWVVVLTEKLVNIDSAYYQGVLFHKYLPVALLFGLALCAGLIGDLILALRPLRPATENESIILAGIIPFFSGHVFYFSALVMLNRFNWIPILFTIIMTGIVFIMAKYMKMVWGRSLIPSLLYSAMIFLMIGQAFYNLIDQSFSGFNLVILIGAILFGVSDLILSQIYFKPAGQQRMVIMNLATYYAAQIAIALSLLFLV